jgi:hypothetical protein
VTEKYLQTGVSGRFNRRGFLQAAVAAGAAVFASGTAYCNKASQEAEKKPEPRDADSVVTNISTALAVPKKETSMPGPFPGVVAEVTHSGATKGRNPNHCDPEAAAAMLAAAMSSLTGEKDVRDAWARFFKPGERVGIKVNPTGGKLLSNTHELNHAIISSLEQIGIKRSDIVIWDREEDLLFDAKYTPENYPGVRCAGMCHLAEENGKKVIRGMDRIDENVFYEFDIEQEYDGDIAPYMLHTGRRSHFAKLVTEELDKIINVAVLKNMGPTVTLCLKNLSYGSTSNCRRGHAIMNRYIAEVCAFPPLRDKAVLNIVDGLRGCYEGGPAAQAHYIWGADTIWAATDPVSVDSVCWDLIASKRIEKGIATHGQVEEGRRKYDFLVRAENLGLGVFKSREIEHRITGLA